MKDLMTDDALTKKLVVLIKTVLQLVVDKVDDCEQGEFVLAFCHDFIVAKLATRDHGERWLHEEKRLV